MQGHGGAMVQFLVRLPTRTYVVQSHGVACLEVQMFGIQVMPVSCTAMCDVPGSEGVVGAHGSGGGGDRSCNTASPWVADSISPGRGHQVIHGTETTSAG